MTEQIIALATAMGASESQREVLEPLCAAAEQALTASCGPESRRKAAPMPLRYAQPGWRWMDCTLREAAAR